MTMIGTSEVGKSVVDHDVNNSHHNNGILKKMAI